MPSRTRTRTKKASSSKTSSSKPKSRTRTKSRKSKSTSTSTSTSKSKPKSSSKSRSKSRSRSRSKSPSKRSRTSGGKKKEGLREYRLIEKQNGEATVTSHTAINKGPGDAAVKLARPFFGDNKTPGKVVRLTITKISEGRNQGAIYEYEVSQKLVALTDKDKRIPKNLIVDKDGKTWKSGKKFRLKRYATKIKTYTPTMMKRAQTQKRKRRGETGRKSKGSRDIDADSD